MARAEARDPTPIWGLTFRSQATEELWRATPERDWRVCAFLNDPDVGKYRRELGLGVFTSREEGAHVELWRAP